MNNNVSSGAPTRAGTLPRFFRDLGPGLITGAADDDPSGIPPIRSRVRHLVIPCCGPPFSPFPSWLRCN